MGFQGPDFTWNQGHVYARLDRALCNFYWDEQFPEAFIDHLLWVRLDHRPLLLCTEQNFGPSLSDTITNFSTATDIWNRTVFGYIGAKKRTIMARLRGGPNNSWEELLWKQKSQSDWITSGDRNTEFFHQKAKIRKFKNNISSLKLADNEWCNDEERL
ncbi:uncharacterized protein LOC120207353 [Hibiscus syriacus]|uniref:uncharacterized protein LOC120207353 n=1 Tax=Hibiscus syriacus TaxID=106335 RepID=UPI0019214B67|nr:uncharacterized protein LOC120207353 [Hibiscus syriacus]